MAQDNTTILEIGTTPTAVVYKNEALSLYHLEKYEQALKSINKSLELDNNSAQAFDIRGLIFHRMKKNDKALEDVEKAIEINSDNKNALYHKGIIQLANRDYDDSRRCFEQAVSVDPNFAEAYNAKGAALAYLQDYKSALQSIERAIELKPSLPSAHENLVKLSLNAESRSTNFVDFWNTTYRRITIAIIICVSIAIMVGYSFLVGGDRSLEVQETIDSNGIRNVTSTTRTGFAIPETTIIVIGILVFILLIPEIRKAKVGPIEFEMSPREAIPLDPSIDYVDNPLYIIL